jgi:hypothetical protein
MKAIDHHLYNRNNNNLYYRYAIPRDLHAILPFKEICLSLKTRDTSIARLYVAKLDIEIQKLISELYICTDQTNHLQNLDSAIEQFIASIGYLKTNMGTQKQQCFSTTPLQLKAPSKKTMKIIKKR